MKMGKLLREFLQSKEPSLALTSLLKECERKFSEYSNKTELNCCFSGGLLLRPVVLHCGAVVELACVQHLPCCPACGSARCIVGPYPSYVLANVIQRLFPALDVGKLERCHSTMSELNSLQQESPEYAQLAATLRSSLEQEISQHPTAQAFLLSARVHSATNDLPAAIAAAQRAFELAPRSPVVLAFIAELLTKQGDITAATSHTLAQALSQGSGSVVQESLYRGANGDAAVLDRVCEQVCQLQAATHN